MANIQSREDFENWLKTQPIEIAQAMATRTALRVLPLWHAPEGRSDLTLSLFRTLFMLWATHAYPTTDMRSAAAAYSDTIEAIDYSATLVASVANAALAAAATYSTAFANDTTAAGIAVDTAAFAANPAFASILENISVDSDMVDAAGAGGVLKRLIESPLWSRASPWPGLVTAGWARLSSELVLRDQSEGWRVWTHWYERRLQGVTEGFAGLTLAQDEAFSVELALQPDDFWKASPSSVNKWMADRLDKLRTPKAPEVQPASIRPNWQGSLLVQEAGLDTVFDNDAAQAMLDAIGLDYDDFHSDLIQRANVSEAALDLLLRTSKHLKEAKLSRAHLFRLANRILEIELYRPTVVEEWKPENSIRYDALYLRFNDTLNGFSEIKNYLEKIPKPDRNPQQIESLAELETTIEDAFQTDDAKVIIDETLIDEHRAAFADLKDDLELRRRPGGKAPRPSGSFENMAGGIANTLSRLLEKAQISLGKEADRHADEVGPYATKVVVYIWKHLKRLSKASTPGGVALYFSIIGEGTPALAAALSLLTYVALAISERRGSKDSE